MQQPPDDDDNRPVPQLGSLTAPPDRPDLKKRIMESKQKLLNNIKGKFTGEDTGRWLDNIDQSPSRADESIDSGSLIDESQLSMPAFVDMLFDHLQRYVFEYNKIPSNQDNLLNCERPHNYQERAEYGAQSTRVKYMRGHLSSHTWSLVFDALDEEISLYVLPTEFLIGFEPTSDFEPYLVITKEMGMTSVMWTINGKRLGVEELTRFARKLITHLVKVIKGEAQSTEKFSFSPTENRFEDPVSPDRSFEQIPESDIGLHRAAKDVYAPSYKPVVGLPPMPEIPPVPETRSRMLKRLMEIAQQEEQEARSFVMSGVRQLSDRAMVAAPSLEVAPAMAAQSMPKPPGAFGAPGAPSGMPTPPGAFGQGGGNSSGILTGPPGGFGMPTPPGALGSVGVPSGTTPPFPTPPGGLGGLPSAASGQAPGAQAAPTPPSFPMPPGAFGAPPSQAPAPQPSVSQNSAPPITAPGGFGAALGALGSLVPPGQSAPAGNELSRILDMPVTAETGPLPAPSGVSPMPGVPHPPQGSAPIPPDGLGFSPPGGFGQPPRPSTSTGANPPVAPVAPQLPPGFGMPAAEASRPESPESNHTERDDEFEDLLPPAPSGGWDFSFPSGPAASAAGATPALPPPAPPAPPPMPPMPPQMAPQMAQGGLAPVSPVVPAPATLPAAPLAPPSVADGSPPPAGKSASRGVSALFDEDDLDEPLAEIVEPPAAPPVPAAPTAPTGRGLAGLVRRDAAPKPPEPPSTGEASASPRSLKDAVASAILGADEPSEAPGERAKRPTLQSLLSGSDSGEPAPVSLEPKIQALPPVGQLGLPLSQPGQSVTDAPVVQQASPAAQPSSPPPAAQPAAGAAQFVSEPQAQPVVFSTGDPLELAKQVDDAQRSAVEGCNRIVGELDIALKGLQEAGARAMQEGNFEAVTKVMEQANRLKGVRERMAQLTQEIAGV